MRKLLFVLVVAVAMIVGVVAYAGAAADSGSVNVNATVAGKLTMTVPAAVNFGTIEPGVTVDSQTATVAIKSNAPYTFVTTRDAGAAINPFITETPTVPGTKGATSVTVQYDLDFTPDTSFDLDPNSYTEAILYTATQI